MEVFRLNIPKDVYLGTPDQYHKTTEDLIYLIAANGIEGAKDLCKTFIGEKGSGSSGFDVYAFETAFVLEEAYNKLAENRAKGYLPEEERHILSLLKSAAYDLGSIHIDRAVFLVSNNGKQLVGARIEAHEQERHRVIYLDDKHDAFANLKPAAIVSAVEQKF